MAIAWVGCGGGGQAQPPPPPAPNGCITDVTPGAHTFTCEGLRTDLYAPPACARAGCGLILELHGDTGTGLLIDANTGLMDLVAQGSDNYVVVAPTGPPRNDGLGPTWTPAEDDKLMAIIDAVAGAFHTNRKAHHVTGFSRGGYVTWRLMCAHADRFASIAPGGAGSAPGGGCDGVQEASCPFDAGVAGGMPARAVPVLMLIGRTDTAVPAACAWRIRDQAVAAWQLAAPQTLAHDLTYSHQRWSPPSGYRGVDPTASGLLETFEHAYETVPDGPEAMFKGHCIPGSNLDPYAPQYAVACAPPNAFRWGEEVLRFFRAHPDR